MEKLQARLSPDSGDVIQGTTINLGQWDVELGMKKTFYLRNPNDYAKANMSGIRHKDSRIIVDMPDEIPPLASVPVKITIPPMKFKDAADEKAFFQDVIDSLYGTIVWEKP